MIKYVKATEMKPGDVLALPMGRTATVTEVVIGTKFVNFSTKEYGFSRAEKNSEVLIEKED